MPVGSVSASANAQSSDGDQSAGLSSRSAPARRAGSSQTPPTPVRSVVVASPELDAGRGEGREVEAGDRGGGLVALHGENAEVERGHGQRVGADAAAEVGDHVDARAGEPAGVQRGDAEPGGLLEAVGGEQHPRRRTSPNLARALARSLAWPSTAATRSAGCPAAAQPRDDPHHIGRRVDGADLVEQAQPLGREQRAQLGDIHPATLLRMPVGSGWHSH